MSAHWSLALLQISLHLAKSIEMPLDVIWQYLNKTIDRWMSERASFILSGRAFVSRKDDSWVNLKMETRRPVTLEQSSVPSGLSPPLQISHSVVPKPQRSAAKLSLWGFWMHSGGTHGIRSTRTRKGK